jgi:hypothetical protein
MAEMLIRIVVDEKKIPLTDLMSREYSLPADRIIRFLKLLKLNLNLKKVQDDFTQIDSLYMQETQYALAKMNKRDMFTATNELLNMIKR